MILRQILDYSHSSSVHIMSALMGRHVIVLSGGTSCYFPRGVGGGGGVLLVSNYCVGNCSDLFEAGSIFFYPIFNPNLIFPHLDVDSHLHRILVFLTLIFLGMIFAHALSTLTKILVSSPAMAKIGWLIIYTIKIHIAPIPVTPKCQNIRFFSKLINLV